MLTATGDHAAAGRAAAHARRTEQLIIGTLGDNGTLPALTTSPTVPASSRRWRGSPGPPHGHVVHERQLVAVEDLPVPVRSPEPGGHGRPLSPVPRTHNAPWANPPPSLRRSPRPARRWPRGGHCDSRSASSLVAPTVSKAATYYAATSSPRACASQDPDPQTQGTAKNSWGRIYH